MAEEGFEPRVHAVLWQFMIAQCMEIAILVVFFFFF